VGYHERVIEACLRKNVSVFVEKPPVRNLARLLHFVAESKSSPVNITVGLNLLFTEVISKVRRYAEEQNLEVRKIYIEYFTNKPRKPLWELESLLESFLLAIAIHPLSVAFQFLGESTKVEGAEINQNGDLLSVKVRLKSDNGIAEILCGNDQDHHSCKFEFGLSNGIALYADGLGSLILRADNFETPLWSPSPLSLSLNSNGFYGEMKQFVENVRNGRSIDCLSSLIPLYETIDTLLTGGHTT
jgi:predicted dehydrogenase